jgi:hypothetical protein
MSVRPNVQSPIKLKDGMLTVHGESTMPRFEVLHVVVVQQGEKADGVAEGEPLKDSVNWTALLPAGGITTGEAEALGVEIRVDPFQVTSWSQTVQVT